MGSQSRDWAGGATLTQRMTWVRIKNCSVLLPIRHAWIRTGLAEEKVAKNELTIVPLAPKASLPLPCMRVGIWQEPAFMRKWVLQYSSTSNAAESQEDLRATCTAP